MKGLKRAKIEYDDGSEYVGPVNADGDPEGEEGFMKDSFGSEWRGEWANGLLHGPGSCANVDGSTFRGDFVDGQMVRGQIEFPCSGKLSGPMNGKNHHGRCTFVFPDGEATLSGTWKDGEMENATFCNSEARFCFEGAFPGRNPTLADPYESALCFVKPSGIVGAGEGLFAKIPLRKGLIVCYYWGAVISQEDVDQRSQEDNQNVVLLDGFDHCLDVPRPFDKLENYCATVGHKANHSREKANCEYVDAIHPRFGVTSALRTLRDIAALEEILLDYEFVDETLPWY